MSLTQIIDGIRVLSLKQKYIWSIKLIVVGGGVRTVKGGKFFFQTLIYNLFFITP